MPFKILDWIALSLLIIGGLDLGIVGLFNYDFLTDMVGDMLIITHIIFLLIGLAAVYVIFRLRYLSKILQPIP